MKKIFYRTLAVSLSLTLLSGCSFKNKSGTSTDQASKKLHKIAMVADTGGINDRAFNQSAWEGLQTLKRENPEVSIAYKESRQASDYATNYDSLVDEGYELIIGIGNVMKEPILEASKKNPEVSFAIIDDQFEETPSNVTAIVFKAQDVAFLVGYIAAYTTQTDKIGFIGGMQCDTISQFEYGFKGGVSLGAKRIGKNIPVSSQYVGSFSDTAKGKAIASQMCASGIDVIFLAAGSSGTGAIEAIKEAGKGKFAIGVDRDQSELAPDNVLTSALKNTGDAIKILCTEFIEGGGAAIGGKTVEFSLDKGLGLPEVNKNIDRRLYDTATGLKKEIIEGGIKPPFDQTSYEEFIKTLSSSPG